MVPFFISQSNEYFLLPLPQNLKQYQIIIKGTDKKPIALDTKILKHFCHQGKKRGKESIAQSYSGEQSIILYLFFSGGKALLASKREYLLFFQKNQPYDGDVDIPSYGSVLEQGRHLRKTGGPHQSLHRPRPPPALRLESAAEGRAHVLQSRAVVSDAAGRQLWEYTTAHEAHCWILTTGAWK